MSWEGPTGRTLEHSAASSGEKREHPGVIEVEEGSGRCREPIDLAELSPGRALDALQRGWHAHLLGDRVNALLFLDSARAGVEELEERGWPLAMRALSLYAFTQSSVGRESTAIAAAQRAALTARQHDPSRNTPRAIRLRLASQLPVEPLIRRLWESLERWALAVAYRLPSTHYRLAHESDLNRLRSARLSSASDVAESRPS